MSIDYGLQLKKVWYDSIWVKLHNMHERSCSCQLGEAAGLTPVSVRQVKSKDVPCSDD